MVLEKLFIDELRLPMQIVDVPYPVAALGAMAMECCSVVSGKEPRLTRYGAGVLAFDMTLSLDRARADLGYVPCVSLDEGISRTASWLRNHG